MTISNSLIIVSFLFTVFAFINPNLYNFWITNYFLNENNSFIFLLQILLYQFIHWWFFHFFFNSLFVYIFWNQLEVYIWKIKYLLFFIFNTLFVAFFLMMLSDWVTIWISGFCMALLTYFTLELFTKWSSEYKWWVTAIVLNIIIWFDPSISLVGHLFWCIAWFVFFLWNQLFIRFK